MGVLGHVSHPATKTEQASCRLEYINKDMMKSKPKNMEVRRGVELSLERGSLSGQDSRIGSF